MKKVQIATLRLKFQGKEIELTIEEARDLQQLLNETLAYDRPICFHPIINPPPVYVPTVWPAPYPYWPYRYEATITTSAKTTDTSNDIIYIQAER